jgi:hypothetical protein
VGITAEAAHSGRSLEQTACFKLRFAPSVAAGTQTKTLSTKLGRCFTGHRQTCESSFIDVALDMGFICILHESRTVTCMLLLL